MNARTLMMLGTLPLLAVGCFTVKTESEVKPIHITLDINLKVDKELDKAFADEDMAKPKGNFAEVKKLLDRQVAGINNRALLEVRKGATDDDQLLIAETNAQRLKRFRDISKANGISMEEVQKRSLTRYEEKVPVGSKVWIQRADGGWYQK